MKEQSLAQGGSGAGVFASSSFLSDFRAYLCRGHSAASLPKDKPRKMSFLSSEVSARLAMLTSEQRIPVPCKHQRRYRQWELTGAEDLAAGDDVVLRKNSGIVEINWAAVNIPSRVDSHEAFVQGAHLAVMCHAALRKLPNVDDASSANDHLAPLAPSVAKDRLSEQQKSQQLGVRLTRQMCCQGTVGVDAELVPFASALQSIYHSLVDGSDEDAFVATCVCLTILEKKLYDIYHAGPPTEALGETAGRPEEASSTATSSSCHVGCDDIEMMDESTTVRDEGVSCGTRRGSLMILRDLIATPPVKAALPAPMVTLLRLLLLPQGFNIRNLVIWTALAMSVTALSDPRCTRLFKWHGFLAPAELPRELASLILVITRDIPGTQALQRSIGVQEVHSTPPNRSWIENQRLAENDGDNLLQPTTVATEEDFDGTPPTRFLRSRHLANPDRCSEWALTTFDDRLKCPSALISAVQSLFCRDDAGDCHRQRHELCDLMRRSAFVLPGRENLALFALEALTEGKHLLCLVAVLPVLEHGLRCLFACANESPHHLFAQLHQYYSTLDGFGQRARHQLLLDQEMAGFPDRPNLLLAFMGPGLSACLLDIFMMDAGPGLRGKIAHAEVDMSEAYADPSTKVNSASGGRHHGDLVYLAVAVFLVLCARYDPVLVHVVQPSGAAILNDENPKDTDAGNDSSSASFAAMSMAQARTWSNVESALASCDAQLRKWAPRFHPHEILENNMQACWHQFNFLALELERRQISVELLPTKKAQMSRKLARLSVLIHPSDETLCGSTRPPSHARAEKSAQGTSAGRTMNTAAAQKVDRETTDEKTLHGKEPVVLTVTDTAYRLIRLFDDSRDGGGKACVKKSTANQPHKGASTDGGVPTLTARVRDALQRHIVSVADRFGRIPHFFSGNHDGLHGKDSPKAGFNHSAASRCAGYDERSHESGVPVTSRASSAFAVYMHSERCADNDTCHLQCVDSARTKESSEGEAGNSCTGRVVEEEKAPVLDCTGKGYRKEANCSTDVKRPTAKDTCYDHDDTSCCKCTAEVKVLAATEGAEDEEGKRDHPTAHEGGTIECTHAPTNRTLTLFRRQQKLREAKRISPHTDVVTVVPLPQMGCLIALYRATAKISRGMRARIFELENQVSSGAARSGHRRAYAATLTVAPTILCFLALTMSAVEAFVLEWHLRQKRRVSATSSSGLQLRTRPGITVSDLNEVIKNVGTFDSCGACGAHDPETTVAGKGHVDWGSPEPPSGLDGTQEDGGVRGNISKSCSQSKLGSRRRPRVSNFTEDEGALNRQLAFLRRLSAVIGSFSSCVPIDEGGTGDGAGSDRASYEKNDSKDMSAGGRKGYPQALTELAVFLETKVAVQGFSTRAS